MKDLWKYRWHTFGIFWILFAIIMFIPNTAPALFFTMFYVWCGSMILMMLIGWTHHRKMWRYLFPISLIGYIVAFPLYAYMIISFL